MNKTILVVMPAYNSEQTIGWAIESILKQTYRHLKLIVIDDCSTDNTVEIARNYARKDSRVSVYSNKKNQGAYYSRNMGLLLASRENWGYFTTHDADDISFEHRYATLIKYLDKNVVGVGDTFVRTRLSDNKEIGDFTTMAHALFKKKVFEGIGYFEQVRFGGDWEYWARLREYNKLNDLTTRNCKTVLGISYIHENNLTVQIPERSVARAKYVKSTRKKLKKLSITGKLYENFSGNIKDVKRIS